MDLGLLEGRLRAAHQYFAKLNAALQSGWEPLFAEYTAGTLAFCETLVLVHPVWLEDAVSVPPRRRVRSFSQAIPSYERCGSGLLWGYECPFEQQLEVDHLFPWSLGGPTLPGNALYLCRNHNRAKAHDIHLIPWEDSAHFLWLDDEVQAVRAVRHAG